MDVYLLPARHYSHLPPHLPCPFWRLILPTPAPSRSETAPEKYPAYRSCSFGASFHSYSKRRCNRHVCDFQEHRHRAAGFADRGERGDTNAGIYVDGCGIGFIGILTPGWDLLQRVLL